VIARIFNCYGPRETHPYVVPEIVSQLHRGNRLRLGNVDACRDLTFVQDTAAALVALLRADLPDGEPVNVGSDNSVSVRGLADTLARIMNVRGLGIEEDPARLRRRDIDWFRCDNTLLRERTGWHPRVGLDEGLRLTVTWFLEHGGRWSWEAPAPATLPNAIVR
jgi:nucleoside-diphosphate-sugar epimerase